MRIKFGIQIENQFGFDFSILREIIINLEKKGYNGFFTSDRFFFLDNESENKKLIKEFQPENLSE